MLPPYPSPSQNAAPRATTFLSAPQSSTVAEALRTTCVRRRHSGEWTAGGGAGDGVCVLICGLSWPFYRCPRQRDRDRERCAEGEGHTDTFSDTRTPNHNKQQQEQQQQPHHQRQLQRQTAATTTLPTATTTSSGPERSIFEKKKKGSREARGIFLSPSLSSLSLTVTRKVGRWKRRRRVSVSASDVTDRPSALHDK